ncbi:putative ankyrin repeat protein RF_0381 [Nasonia vitripennis]|uniref:Uncharacterized protein n=1 Tax=Nasonia vitripennis TaxID=7425 RepID=A0A7M7IYW2_NASVI|nr:putative ankyrin repeat protein RF_0381 [Nasonia vitripennis]
MADPLTASNLRALILRTVDALSSQDLILLSKIRGVDLKSRNSSRQTVLHLALEHDLIELVEYFLENGANPNAADYNGETPLLTAAKSRQAKRLLPLVMRYGANPTARNVDGWNALHYLIRIWTSQIDGHVDLVKTLIAKGVLIDDRENDTKQQPIHVAVQYRKLELVKLLLDKGANIDAQAENGNFPLYFAAVGGGSPILLKTLLERGANVDMRNNGGQTALHAACEKRLADSNRQCIKLLLDAGADLFAEDNKGNTAVALVNQNLRGWIYWNGYLNSDIALMVKATALKKISLPPSTVMKDEGVLREHPKIWEFYQNCIRCAAMTRDMIIIKNCSLYDLLTTCHCRIAKLMRHQDFETRFERYNLKDFSMYGNDIRIAFERAKHYHDSMLQQEDDINEAAYYTLPDLIVRNLVRCIFDCGIRKCTLRQQ